MTPAPDSPDARLREAERIYFEALGRDDLHLRPLYVSQAVARRARQAIRALEAFLMRLLMVMALAIEPTLNPSGTPRPIRMAPAGKRALSPGFRIKFAESMKDFPFMADGVPGAGGWRERPVALPAAPLLSRLGFLRAVIADPGPRARRLAFHLARRKPGWLAAPGEARLPARARNFTETSALYAAMGSEIRRTSRARPPPLGPAPRPPPRIRAL